MDSRVGVAAGCVYISQTVYTVTSKNCFTKQRLKNCTYYVHVFYVFCLSNNFMYFTRIIIYHNRSHSQVILV